MVENAQTEKGRNAVDEKNEECAANPSSDFEYRIMRGKVTITGLKNEKMQGEVVIPQIINGLPVTRIGCAAFKDCHGLTRVTIPNSVTKIEDLAFTDCDGLTEIQIPNSVPLIALATFSGCDRLTKVQLPNSIKAMDYGAFGGCERLTEIEIPSSVTEINDGAFWGGPHLIAINVSPDNPCYQSIDGVLFTKDGKTLQRYPAGRSGAYRIPNGVTSIGEWDFDDCRELTEIEIPSSVTEINDYAFRDCSHLTAINVSSDNPCYRSIDGVLFTKDGKTLLDYPADKSGDMYQIPDSVTEIGNSAFKGHHRLTSVIIPDGVIKIGFAAFSGCQELRSMTLPNSVTIIGTAAFEDCCHLMEMELSENLASIGNAAFKECANLTSMTIPASVTEIDDYAFEGCCHLTTVSFSDSTIKFGREVFGRCPNLTIDATRGSDIWKYFRKQRFEKWRKYLRNLWMFLVVSVIFLILVILWAICDTRLGGL